MLLDSVAAGSQYTCNTHGLLHTGSVLCYAALQVWPGVCWHWVGVLEDTSGRA